MLRCLKEINEYFTVAKDGDLGKVADFYFDDHYWVVRYLVVDTSRWLPGRKVLLSPVAIDEANWLTRNLHLDLTREQIKESPSINEDKPVSRQIESELAGFFNWPFYWGAGVPPKPKVKRASMDPERPGDFEKHDPALRSAREVFGYRIHTTGDDEHIGHVEDIIVDDELWDVRYLVVDTGNIIPGKKALVSIFWIDTIEFGNMRVNVEMKRAELENAPPFDPEEPVNREVELRHYDFYGRPYDW